MEKKGDVYTAEVYTLMQFMPPGVNLLFEVECKGFSKRYSSRLFKLGLGREYWNKSFDLGTIDLG